MKEKLAYFIQQVRQREGEHEQSLLRVFFTLPIFIYLFIEFYFVTPTSIGSSHICILRRMFRQRHFAGALYLVQTQFLQKTTMAGNVCRHRGSKLSAC